jgi:toxin ParE1/3/4
MIAQIHFSQRALRDLEEIWQYSFDNWGEAQADTYIGAIHDTLNLLAGNTVIARSAGDVRPGLWRYPAGSHLIYFRLSRGMIRVVRVLHSRMDAVRHI